MRKLGTLDHVFLKLFVKYFFKLKIKNTFLFSKNKSIWKVDFKDTFSLKESEEHCDCLIQEGKVSKGFEFWF